MMVAFNNAINHMEEKFPCGLFLDFYLASRGEIFLATGFLFTKIGGIKMKVKKISFIVLMMIGFLSLAACTNQEDTTGKIKIGILQLLDQTALNDVRQGFEEELAQLGYGKEEVAIQFLNAQGDQSNLKMMADQIKNRHNDLNIAIATPAAQALKKSDNQTPLLFTAITDPVSAGLIENLAAPEENFTGVTDRVDVAGQIDFLHELFPQAQTVGLLYNAAEANSVFQIELARKKLAQLNLKVVEKTIASTNDVEQAATALADQSDVIYIPADNVAAAAMPTIGKVSEKMKVPVITADATMIQYAGIATLGINYQDLGRQTARLAIKILNGEKVAQLPVEDPAAVTLVYDEKRLALFDLTVEDLPEK